MYFGMSVLTSENWVIYVDPSTAVNEKLRCCFHCVPFGLRAESVIIGK